jgi:hypothetical protein
VFTARGLDQAGGPPHEISPQGGRWAEILFVSERIEGIGSADNVPPDFVDETREIRFPAPLERKRKAVWRHSPRLRGAVVEH